MEKKNILYIIALNNIPFCFLLQTSWYMRKKNTNTFVTILTKRSLNSLTKTFSSDDNDDHDHNNINEKSVSLIIYYLLCFAIFYQHVDLYSTPFPHSYYFYQMINFFLKIGSKNCIKFLLLSM